MAIGRCGSGGGAWPYLRAVDKPSFSASVMDSLASPSRWALAFSLAVLAVALAAPDVPMPEEEEDDDSVLSTNCTRCTPHEEARELRIEAIKAQILSKLGMKRAPNVTRAALPHVPPLHRLLDRYDVGMMQADAPAQAAFEDGAEFDEDDYHVAAENVISFGQEAPPELGLLPEWKAQYFRFSESVLNHRVSKAHLWLYVSPNTTHSSAVWVTLYKVARGSLGELHLHKVRAKEEKVHLRQGFWVQIDVQKLVSRWFRRPEENLGIVAHAYDQDGRRIHITTDPPPQQDALRPFIAVVVEAHTRSRARRMVGLNCQENSSEERCCRYPLTVDFEQFGWDWIIAPKRYEANYCSGECPYVFLQKYPHTHLIQQVNLSGSAGPCCAPRKISAISMLYFDDNHNIIYGVLPGMIVDRCGCY
ncbi:growth/differentiation factor 8-like [Ornithodoros turicata]